MRTALLISSAYGWFAGLLAIMLIMAVLFVFIVLFALKPIKMDDNVPEQLAQKLLEKRQTELTIELLNNKENKEAAEKAEQELRDVSTAQKIVSELLAKELGVSAKKTYGVDSGLTAAEEESLEKGEKQAIEHTFGEAAPAAGEDGIKKSFTAKLMQAGDDVKVWYFELKNCLLCYEKTKARMHWNYEKFYVGKNNAATLTMRGKVLCLYLALEPQEYAGRFPVKASQSEAFKQVTPCLFRIRNEKGVKLAKELIALLMSDYGVLYVKTNHSIYALPYEDDDALVAKGLAKKQ